jgi:predicted NBD/HSP70 family sugar kinase
MRALVFDLGGTFLRAGVADLSGRITQVTKVRIPSVSSGCVQGAIWEHISSCIIEYESAYGAQVPGSAPIVISFPGPITGYRHAHQAATVAGSGPLRFDIASMLEARTGRRVLLLNDVSAAAWRIAEMTEARRFLVVTVSSGIGSKMFVSGPNPRVIDHLAYAGEIGHVVVDDSPSAPICDCGARGHLGAIASGRGFERHARHAAQRNARDFQNSKLVQEFGATPQTITNEEHLVPAILAGDPWAIEVLMMCTRPLARVLLMIAVAAGLDRVFVIGGFAQALGNAYLERLRGLAFEASKFQLVEDSIPSLFQLAPYNAEVCLEGCGTFVARNGDAQIGTNPNCSPEYDPAYFEVTRG